VRPIAERLVEAHDLVLWDVRFVREAGRDTLQVACDRLGGVTADELAAVAEDVSRELDHSDAVPGERRYLLEVTSPGAERRLQGAEQFRVCARRDARVTLRDGRVVEGKIDGASPEIVQLQTSDGAVRVFYADIARAQLIVPEGFGGAQAPAPPPDPKRAMSGNKRGRREPPRSKGIG
jgi:ribosome maturation factor RimP